MTTTPRRAGHGSELPVTAFDVYDNIILVDGPEGERLAAQQAKAILDVLTFLHDQATTSIQHPSPKD